MTAALLLAGAALGAWGYVRLWRLAAAADAREADRERADVRAAQERARDLRAVQLAREAAEARAADEARVERIMQAVLMDAEYRRLFRGGWLAGYRRGVGCGARGEVA